MASKFIHEFQTHWEEARGPLFLFGVPAVATVLGYVTGIPVWGTLFSHPLIAVGVLVAMLFATHKLSQGGTLPSTYRVDLRGKNAIVTGGNNGIGFKVAVTLAKWGANVVIGCRNMQAGEAAVAAIIAESGATGPNQVKVIQLDLASQVSVRAFADAWLKQSNGKLDILCNNAGIMFTPYGTTKDGLELQWGTNHLGHFLLTNLLTNPIKAAKGRIVCVSSLGHRFAEENLDYEYLRHPVPQGYNPQRAYGWAKCSNILHARELENRLQGDGVHAYAVHPGVVNTNLFVGSVGQMWTNVSRATIGWLLQKTPQAGADAVLFCCVHPDATPGRYHKDCRRVDTATKMASSDAEARRLWDESMKCIVN